MPVPAEPEIFSKATMVEALQERGIGVDYILKEDEGHGFMKEENRLELYRAMERFLAKHLDTAGEMRD